MDSYKIWEVVSYTWTEIGLADDEYPKFVEEIKLSYSDWGAVDKIIKRDVIGSFATFQFLVFPCFLWMLMPDWMWDEKEIKQKMDKWYSKPIYLHYINPFRIIGYPLALSFSMPVRRKLKHAFQKNT